MRKSSAGSALLVLPTLLFMLPMASAHASTAQAVEKPKLAIFPLAGSASADLREKVGYALRTKLGRLPAYEVVDGYTMTDWAGGSAVPFSAGPAEVKKLADRQASVLVWGELIGGQEGLTGSTLHLKVLDLRQPTPEPHEITKAISGPTDLRFVIEQILESLPGVKDFSHPNEQAVKDDTASKRLWKSNPNLLANGDFSVAGKWTALYQSEKYPVAMAATLPSADKVNICPISANDAVSPRHAIRTETNYILAMRLSRQCAENNGLACISEPITIKPGRRYRISFRYWSDGPSTHVFVKGYTTGPALDGKPTDREIFRTQVSPTGATQGQWKTVVCDVNPYHPAFHIERLRVDLYAYLTPGIILWDDVVLKEIGPLVDKPTDEATKAPATAPAGAI